MNATYDIFKCNRCEGLEFSFFDASPKRYCKTKKLFLTEQKTDTLKIIVGCKEHKRAKKGKAQFLDAGVFKSKYLRKKKY